MVGKEGVDDVGEGGACSREALKYASRNRRRSVPPLLMLLLLPPFGHRGGCKITPVYNEIAEAEMSEIQLSQNNFKIPAMHRCTGRYTEIAAQLNEFKAHYIPYQSCVLCKFRNSANLYLKRTKANTGCRPIFSLCTTVHHHRFSGDCN
jgi:hypothetical protein